MIREVTKFQVICDQKGCLYSVYIEVEGGGPSDAEARAFAAGWQRVNMGRSDIDTQTMLLCPPCYLKRSESHD